MIDLDHFKHVNDAFGHRAGDDLLSIVGALRRRPPRDDLLARLGGDEFALLLPHADAGGPAGRRDPGEALRRTCPPVEGRPVRVTASIGVAHFGGDCATGEELLAYADRAMYLAKESGATA